MIKVLELFSGSGILSEMFRVRGHGTTTVDNCYDADIKQDIMEFNINSIMNYDIVWMSPPCQTFSMAVGNTHWTADRQPKTDKGKEAKALILKCKEIAEYCIKHNKTFFIENPRARARWFLPKEWRKTITYCRYGETRMKPTDIWTNCKTWNPIDKMCHNGNPDHDAAPRGSKTGTQGLKNAFERGKLPKQLCIEIIEACEKCKDIL